MLLVREPTSKNVLVGSRSFGNATPLWPTCIFTAHPHRDGVHQWDKCFSGQNLSITLKVIRIKARGWSRARRWKRTMQKKGK